MGDVVSFYKLNTYFHDSMHSRRQIEARYASYRLEPPHKLVVALYYHQRMSLPDTPPTSANEE